MVVLVLIESKGPLLAIKIGEKIELLDGDQPMITWNPDCNKNVFLNILKNVFFNNQINHGLFDFNGFYRVSIDVCVVLICFDIVYLN